MHPPLVSTLVPAIVDRVPGPSFIITGVDFFAHTARFTDSDMAALDSQAQSDAKAATLSAPEEVASGTFDGSFAFVFIYV